MLMPGLSGVCLRQVRLFSIGCLKDRIRTPSPRAMAEETFQVLYIRNLALAPPPNKHAWDLVVEWIRDDCAAARTLMRFIIRAWQHWGPPSLVPSSDSDNPPPLVDSSGSEDVPIDAPSDSDSQASGYVALIRRVRGLMMP